MKALIKKCRAKLSRLLLGATYDHLEAENRQLRLELFRMAREVESRVAGIAVKSMGNKTATAISSIQETEFRVCSQFGEDGIIQFLIANVDIPNRTFVEFGVEDYTEANTRFLMINDNWSGLVLDGSPANIASIKDDPIYWKHDLTAVNAFITKDNINGLIASRFSGDIGLLSIDIDGNDYWVWEAISVISPRIIVCEYNSVFGDKHSLSIPYRADFVRREAHFSNLYFGASLRALVTLAAQRGYGFVGCNRAGNNAFFVRQDVIGKLPVVTTEAGYVWSKFRESKDEHNQSSFVSGTDRIKLIAAMNVFDFETGQTVSLGSLHA